MYPDRAEVATRPTTLFLAGDVMTGRGIDQAMPHPCEPTLYESCIHDARDYVRLAEGVNGPIARPMAPSSVWGDALAELKRVDPDLRLVNLETAVTTSDDAWPDKGIHYRMHPEHVSCLAGARIDACSLANNHVLDWGYAGLDETLRVLHDAGIATAGAGASLEQAQAPAVLPLPGGTRLLMFAWATLTSGVPLAWAASQRGGGVALLPDLDDADADRVAEQVLRHRHAGDRVVVSLHWGSNWVARIPDEHRRFAHRLVDRGVADVVHGHSSHHPLPVEVYRGRLILAGCGDLINDYEGIEPHGSLRCDVGCLYCAGLDTDGSLLQLEIVPTQLCGFRLRRADNDARRWLEHGFNHGGRVLGTQVRAHADGHWRLHWSD